MQKVPLLSGREVVKVFSRLGWDVARQQVQKMQNQYINLSRRTGVSPVYQNSRQYLNTGLRFSMEREEYWVTGFGL